MRGRLIALALACAFLVHPVEGAPAPAARDIASRARPFYAATCKLAALSIRFDQEWTPPGEEDPWVMDCSNTIRWLYKSIAGITMPRRASDIYLSLRSQEKAWDIPFSNGVASERRFLQRHLKPGDLIFWEDTCFPKHVPPITHVMIFLGRTGAGKSILAGCQTGQRIPGVHTGHNGGIDIYVYDPTDNIGGYITPGMTFKVGHLQAIGRPLEADATQLALDAAKPL